MLTTTEAAELLGITRRRVIALIKSGKLKAEKPGRDWVINTESAEELRKQNRPRGRPKTTPQSTPGGGSEATIRSEEGQGNG